MMKPRTRVRSEGVSRCIVPHDLREDAAHVDVPHEKHGRVGDLGGRMLTMSESRRD
jgi:hypothetical protein